MADGTTTLASPSPAAADPGDGQGSPARAPAEPQIEALGELVGIGLKIARAIERRLDEAEGPQPLAELNAAAVAYARVARAVRQTVMLQERLKAERDGAAAKAGDLRARVARIVRGAAEDEHDDAERVEALAREAAEGLEQERYGDVLIRPVIEIVADICKDLGLRPDWPALEDEILAAEAFARGEAGQGPAAAPAYCGPMEVRWLNSKDDAPIRDTS